MEGKNNGVQLIFKARREKEITQEWIQKRGAPRTEVWKIPVSKVRLRSQLRAWERHGSEQRAGPGECIWHLGSQVKKVLQGGGGDELYFTLLTGEPKQDWELTVGFSHTCASVNLDKNNFWWKGGSENLIRGDGWKIRGEPIHKLWGIIFQLPHPLLLFPPLFLSFLPSFLPFPPSLTCKVGK